MIELFFGSQKIPQDPEFLQGFTKMLNKLVNAEPYLSGGGGNTAGGSMVQSFSWSKDAGMIEAAFLQNYQIDLMNERGKMHWDTFKALFDGLGPKTYFQRILQIRREDPTKIDDPKARQELYDSQNYYAVDGAKTGQERTAQALNNSALGSAFKSLFEDAEKGGN